MRTPLLCVIGTLSLLPSVALAQAPDPFSGTWKLNVAKSRMVSPATASTSETVVYRHEGGEEFFVAEARTVKGGAERLEYRAKLDGPPGRITTTLDGKLVGEGPVQLRVIDARTRLRLGTRPDGSLGGLIVRRLSADGRTLTSSILRFEPDGSIANAETRVFEKQ